MGVGDFVPLIAKALAHFLKEACSINKLDLSFALFLFPVGQYPR
jgi:hypothetical protein